MSNASANRLGAARILAPADGGEPPNADDGSGGAEKEAPEEKRDADGGRALDGAERLFAKEGNGDVTGRSDHRAPKTIPKQPRHEDCRIALGSEPDECESERTGGRSEHGHSSYARRSGLWHPSGDRIASRDVRRHEERHLRHDPLRQPRIRSEVGQRFECIDHATRLVNAGAAFRTLVEVRTKIGDAESGF